MSEDLIVVLIPVFNDWKATGMLLRMLDQELAGQQQRVAVLLIDDASTEAPPEGYLQAAPETADERAAVNGGGDGVATLPRAATVAFASFTKVEVLELRRNLGHQRALAIGLAYLHASERFAAVLIMDGDGEDDPRDVPRLIAAFRAHGGKAIIFARRAERSESLAFRCGYALYRWLHRALTGFRINVGNFSIVPAECVDRLVAVTELWNHYASAVYKARLPHDSIPTRRAARLAGRPRMNFVALVIHGLSSIAAYGDVVGVRMLIASLGVIVATVAGLLTVVVLRVGTELAIPGWATNAFGLLVVILFQAIMSSVLFIFIILGNRQGALFLPVRDYSYFVLRTRRVA